MMTSFICANHSFAVSLHALIPVVTTVLGGSTGLIVEIARQKKQGPQAPLNLKKMGIAGGIGSVAGLLVGGAAQGFMPQKTVITTASDATDQKKKDEKKKQEVTNAGKKKNEQKKADSVQPLPIPTHSEASEKKDDVTKPLRESEKIEANWRYENNARDAVSEGNLEKFKEAISKLDTVSPSVLHKALDLDPASAYDAASFIKEMKGKVDANIPDGGLFKARPLERASKLSTINALLDIGAKPSDAHELQRLLEKAVHGKDQSLLQRLFDEVAEQNISINYKSLFFEAIQVDNVDCVDFLLKKGVKPDEEDCFSLINLAIAKKPVNEPLVFSLIEANFPLDQSTIANLVAHNKKNILQKLAAYPNYPVFQGISRKFAQSLLYVLIKYKVDLALIQQLIAAGADVNRLSVDIGANLWEDYMSPLFRAYKFYKSPELVEELLKVGASVSLAEGRWLKQQDKSSDDYKLFERLATEFKRNTIPMPVAN